MGFMLRLVGEQGPRNYIIDAANSTRARNKKLSIFSGYGKKIAVLFAPPYTEIEKRIEEAKKANVHPPSGAPDRIDLVARQLARFILPEDKEDYDEIIYPDSSKEEVKKIVDQYIEEGKKQEKENPGKFVRRPGSRGGFRRFRGRGRSPGRPRGGRRFDDSPRDRERDSFRGRRGGQPRGRPSRGYQDLPRERERDSSFRGGRPRGGARSPPRGYGKKRKEADWARPGYERTGYDNSRADWGRTGYERTGYDNPRVATKW